MAFPGRSQPAVGDEIVIEIDAAIEAGNVTVPPVARARLRDGCDDDRKQRYAPTIGHEPARSVIERIDGRRRANPG